MSKKDTNLTAEQIYKQNKKIAKIFHILSPVAFYVFVLLGVIFFILMINNSIGNVMEIIHLLDKDVYTGEEIAEHYKYLVEKWGEWEIVGAGGAGLVIRYVDVRNALFSGLMIVYVVLTIISFVLAVVIGKIVFPQLVKLYTNNNDEMVAVATLRSAKKIDDMTAKNSKEDWF